MGLPTKYHVRNVFVRWRATVATVLGVALVVAVFVLVQSLAVGLEASSRNTGDPRNVVLVRKGATAESSSILRREQAQLIEYLPQVERDDAGRPLVSADLVVVVNLPRKAGHGKSHVLFRGISPRGAELRPQVKLVAGRWFQPGQREVVVSRRLAERFENFNVGDAFEVGNKKLTVAGWMDGGNSAFDSEVWMDSDEARAVFNRDNYSSMVVRLVKKTTETQRHREEEEERKAENRNAAREGARPTTETAQGDASPYQEFAARVEADKRLSFRAVPEVQYYGEQTKTALPIKILGNFLAIAMSIGAVFAAMNTMYASVGSRTREIGTLRVLGFRRRTILASFLIEGAILGLAGGALGCLLSLPMHGVTTATISFETFSETVFQFRITGALALKGLAFAVLVGLAGSFLPALRAARLPVIAALQAV